MNLDLKSVTASMKILSETIKDFDIMKIQGFRPSPRPNSIVIVYGGTLYLVNKKIKFVYKPQTIEGKLNWTLYEED